MRRLRNAALAGVAVAAYSYAEAKAFRLVERYVPVSAPIPDLRILHVSDLHLKGRSRRLRAFLGDLPDRLPSPPDLVLATGDLIDDNSAIEPVVEALGRLEARLGRYYVLGSHDYYQSSLKGFLGMFKILLGRERERRTTRPADTAALVDGLESKGWRSLINRSEGLDVPWGRIRLAGTDDPYLNRHTLDHAVRDEGDTLAIALIHAPDIVSEWALAGYDLILAGHTHFGQIRIPPVGTIVTNCSLPSGLAGGLETVGGAWLHVSPGLGTGTFAPFRLGARPEVTLLHLSSRFA